MAEIVVDRAQLDNMGPMLKSLRTPTGISQENISRVFNKKQSFISTLESGKRKKVPSLRTLVPVLNLMGYEIVIREKSS